ncbi:hypothetical protein ID47_04940 [Candidatus Paracaedibacter acanthamoebae]|uniref:Uncharacterized protein n=1 Tax=Candidatus Odyssella acanthamoebae TaxID=91604 RepID=A0A077AW06_9PROT|nr:hypothetical protein ID47_04940 [Candidatus Paracaedibacter acanthamoebae]
MARALNPAFTCFAALSDPLLIQDRRFIQQHGWWYFLKVKSTTALIGDFVSHGLVCGKGQKLGFGCRFAYF